MLHNVLKAFNMIKRLHLQQDMMQSMS